MTDYLIAILITVVTAAYLLLGIADQAAAEQHWALFAVAAFVLAVVNLARELWQRRWSRG